MANAYPLLGLVRGVTLHRITSTDLDAVDADIARTLLVHRGDIPRKTHCRGHCPRTSAGRW